MQENPARKVVDRHLDHGRPPDALLQILFIEFEEPGGLLTIPGIQTGSCSPEAVGFAFGIKEFLQLLLLVGRRMQIAAVQVDPGVDPEVPEPDLVPAPVLEDEGEFLSAPGGVHRKVHRGGRTLYIGSPAGERGDERGKDDHDRK